MYWKSLKESRPTEPGIYVVAEFDGDKMVDYDINWALYDGYFGPNNIGYQVRIEPTHWMSRRDFRALLEDCPRSENDIIL